MGLMILTAGAYGQEAAAARITSLKYSASVLTTNADGSTSETAGPVIAEWHAGPEVRSAKVEVRAQIADPPAPPAPPAPARPARYWRVNCPECGLTFTTGAVADQVRGSRALPRGVIVEEHECGTRCTRPGCGREIRWTREVKLAAVKAEEVKTVLARTGQSAKQKVQSPKQLGN
jgi:hypothetical protein